MCTTFEKIADTLAPCKTSSANSPQPVTLLPGCGGKTIGGCQGNCIPPCDRRTPLPAPPPLPTHLFWKKRIYFCGICEGETYSIRGYHRGLAAKEGGEIYRWKISRVITTLFLSFGEKTRVSAFGVCGSSRVFYLSECERGMMQRKAGIQLKLQCSVFNSRDIIHEL